MVAAAGWWPLPNAAQRRRRAAPQQATHSPSRHHLPTLPPLQGISDAYKDIIRSFLVHFHANIMRQSTKRFDYRGGSVGNFFFAGARIFFRWMVPAGSRQRRAAGLLGCLLTRDACCRLVLASS